MRLHLVNRGVASGCILIISNYGFVPRIFKKQEIVTPFRMFIAKLKDVQT